MPRPATHSDAEDFAAVDAFDRRLAAGEDELIPAAMMERLLGEESPVKIWREHRGLSASELAREAGLSRAYVSQIESGARSPGIDALKAIAQALGVDIDELV